MIKEDEGSRHRLLIVSNRLPITIERRKGNLRLRRSVGGLATGLGAFYQSYNSMWIGWCGVSSEKISGEEKNSVRRELITDWDSHPIFLSRKDIRMYYHGFSNRTIWPLFHYFTHYTVYNKDFWSSYKEVNKLFCDEIVKIAKPDDIIWIHDYHLMYLPMCLREKLPNAKIGFFLHIPFPSFEIFRLIPWRKEVLKGILGADLIGFHIYDYVRHFLSSVRRLLGYEYVLNTITVGNRIVKVDAFPMGIDYMRFADSANNEAVKKETDRMRKRVKDQKIILSVDRLDYTKGLPQRLKAFDHFLDTYPEYKNKVTLIMVAVPSRTGVETYIQLKKEVDEMVGRINGKHGTFGWLPIWYLYRFLSYSSLASLYNLADVALVTPLRDGMNLIAKEYIASKTNGRGVLILSEMAGSVKELCEALVVNPNDKQEVSQALFEALKMSEIEQVTCNKTMQKRLKRYNVTQWANDFIDGLYKTKKLQQNLFSRHLSKKIEEDIIVDYRRSTKRLLLLDYDGTLIPFFTRPEKAEPDKEILCLLKTLTEDRRNKVVIISGRDRKTLDKWFGNLNISLSAEHGVWIKEDSKWNMIEPLRNNWKEEIRSVLELYVDRTPGSFLEEKEYSLVWHYRKADPELTSIRVGELRDDLEHLITNLDICVMEGNKVIEIKNVGVNKARPALYWLSKLRWDFILSIGDDLTDEDIFDILPEHAYSIKVGYGVSKAKFNLGSYLKVRKLIKKIGAAQ
ncbi:bifunctional alpha,alpha-trehalose-phosphate synthase (UDP-forming)/trehalose-phosphatase [candidate division WOR-3 bacterium]|nr:bifunctional alpha,alpha-trehalose-phosphate synthase (UDP-forming)/trehalose-phosphatase [candidate division WOR-3 bacterium]